MRCRLWLTNVTNNTQTYSRIDLLIGSQHIIIKLNNTRLNSVPDDAPARSRLDSRLKNAFASPSLARSLLPTNQ